MGLPSRALARNVFSCFDRVNSVLGYITAVNFETARFYFVLHPDGRHRDTFRRQSNVLSPFTFLGDSIRIDPPVFERG